MAVQTTHPRWEGRQDNESARSDGCHPRGRAVQRRTSTEAFLKNNQVTGFDCQSCAWPSSDKKRKIFEFCENGAKAVSDESTKKRITPEFFAQHSIAELAAKSDYWLISRGV